MIRGLAPQFPSLTALLTKHFFGHHGIKTITQEQEGAVTPKASGHGR